MLSAETFARYAAMRVPRYTSYPTAPNFAVDVGEPDYRSWLGALAPATEISLYLHVPFCREMCWYCGCHTSVARRSEPVARYVDALGREIATLAEALPGRMTVRHLHWGGGSPTLLTAEQLSLLDKTLRTHFDIAADADLAIEIDPRTLTRALTSALGRHGITRASLGVQSFDPKVQKAINRVQSVDQTAAAVALLRGNGVAAINFDLVYGLPHQTVESCLATVRQSLAIRPDRLAVFGYAHVPSFKAHQRKIDPAALPGPQERYEQFEAIGDALVAAGYCQVGLDHFALPADSLITAARSGRLRRNFQGYTTDDCNVLLGLGASSIGRLPQGFVQNATRIPDYLRAIADSRLPIARGYAISAEDQRRAAIIERLMCDYRADIGSVVPPAIGRLERDGLIRRKGSLIEVEDDARPLVRAVAAAFDCYFPDTVARHVTAV